eukprot:3528088-Pyramimonas_sp.AAC.1
MCISAVEAFPGDVAATFGCVVGRRAGPPPPSVPGWTVSPVSLCLPFRLPGLTSRSDIRPTWSY